MHQKNKDESLLQFYKSLSNRIDISNRKKTLSEQDSVLLYLIKIKSNDRLELLRGSSLRASIFSSAVIKELLKNKLILETDEIGFYTITIRGIWEAENRLKKLNLSKLIDFLDSKYFNDIYEISERPMSDKQKLIIFTMICMRSFSENSAVDLKYNEETNSSWQKITMNCYDKLISLKFISEIKDIFGKARNEHPISILFRHTDELPKKTKSLFKAPGDQKYYLDMPKNAVDFNSSLVYLLKQVLVRNNFISGTTRKELYEFMCKVSNENSIFVFDPKVHLFSHPEYDIKLREAMDEV